MDKKLNTGKTKKVPGIDKKASIRDYPIYPVSEDIYSKYKEEDNIDPEDTSRLKAIDDTDDRETDDEASNHGAGNDLDIPGSELDDDQEMIGNEDEENNYYSIGGDGHNDLDEDNPDSW